MMEKDTQTQTDYIDVRHLLLKYSRHWRLFSVCVLLSLAAAAFYIYMATPQYLVESTLLLKNSDQESGSINNKNSALGEIQLFSTKQDIDNEIEVLRSRSLMERVLSELSLSVSYFEEGRLKDHELYGQNLPFRVSIDKLHPSAFKEHVTITRKTSNTFELRDKNGETSVHKYGEEISKPYGIFAIIAAPIALSDNRTQQPVIVKFHDLAILATEYSERLKVETVNKRASVIRISLIESVPERGVAIINKLLEVYGEEALEDRNSVAKNTIAFVDERLKLLSSELSDVEKDVEQYKRQNEVANVSTDADQYRQQANAYNQQLSDLNIQIDVLESIEQYINKQQGKYELVPTSLSIQDPTLVQQVSKYNDLQLERERMLRTTLPNNPLVQALNDQLSSLQLNILENLHNIKNGLAITKKNLELTTGRFRSQIQKVPSIEKDLQEINRRQGLKEELYLYLLQKREESQLALEITLSKSRLLDAATPGQYPISPKKPLICLLALIVGLGAPFSFVYIKDAMNDKVLGKKDIQRLTQTPILGEISQNSTGSTLVVKEESGSSVAELFRLVRSNLQFATAGKENKVIMVTSSTSGEGKTFFSINLAVSLTLIGKKVCLLELDLRKPALFKQLELTPGTGISDYLVASDRIAIEDIIKPMDNVPGLYVASCGSIPPNPAELMLSENLAHLIRELRVSFDYILIDTAPIGKVADAYSLSPLIDSTLYMVRYNYTTKSQLERIEDIYVNKKFAHPMIILNGVKEGAKHAYGYGYNYGYSKREEISVS